MHRGLFVIFFCMIFSALPCIYADNFEDIAFTIDAVSLFSLDGLSPNPSFEFLKENIGGLAKTDSNKKYNLSTNLASWKIDAKIDKVITGVTISVELETVDSPYDSSATTFKKDLDVAESAMTVISGTNGGVANGNSITYSVSTIWAGNAGNHTYTVTFTLSSN